MADNRQENNSKTSETVFRLRQLFKQYRWVILAAAIITASIVGAALFYAHTTGAKPLGSYANLLLQLAAFIFAGLILTPLIEYINKQRDKRGKRMDFLRRMRESHVRIANAQRLIYANPSPETYRQQMRMLMLVTPKLEDIERDVAATTDLFCKKQGDKTEIQEGIREIVAYLDEGYDQYAEWQRNGGATVNYRTLRERKTEWLGELIERERYMPKRYTRALDKSKGVIRSYVYGHSSDAATSEKRFATADDQLGSDKPAVRLAGVYAMAGLADDWEENRQTCVDVLCRYLRMPYEPDPGQNAPEPQRLAFQAIREVRHTVIRVITAHLKKDAAVSWQGLNFDFKGVVFDGGDFDGAQFSGGAVWFNLAEFSGGRVYFSKAQFSGGMVYFLGASFSGGTVYFNTAEFSGGTVDFSGARFSGGTVIFRGAEFSGGTVDFSRAGVCSYPPEFPWTDTPPSGVKLPRKENQSQA